MPLWLWGLLGVGGLYWFAKRSDAQASAFTAGQSVKIAATEVYSDSALAQDFGTYPGGTGTVQSVDTVHNSISFVGPTGQGIGGGAAAWVKASAVTAA